MPPYGIQSPCALSIPERVAVYLVPPVVGILARDPGAFAPEMAVPETAINGYSDVRAGEHNIRFAGESRDAASVT
jgi:hypothetical protein